MAVATQYRVLSDDILSRCAERAPIYDRESRFFTEDFEELRQAGYLRMNVPESIFRTLCPGVMRVFRECPQAKLGPTI